MSNSAKNNFFMTNAMNLVLRKSYFFRETNLRSIIAKVLKLTNLTHFIKFTAIRHGFGKNNKLV